MGKAIGANFEKAGNQVVYAGRDFKKALGDIVVLAVPYGALEAIIGAHADELKGNILIDITNPVNFDTFDSLVVPVDSSAAQEIQKKLPETVVVKAFNTTFAATLASGLVGGKEPTIVLVASDDAEDKRSPRRQPAVCARCRYTEESQRTGSDGIPSDFHGSPQAVRMDRRICCNKVKAALKIENLRFEIKPANMELADWPER